MTKEEWYNWSSNYINHHTGVVASELYDFERRAERAEKELEYWHELYDKNPESHIKRIMILEELIKSCKEYDLQKCEWGKVSKALNELDELK